MQHKVIDQVLGRAAASRSDSDFTYFIDLLLAAEALTKVIAIGLMSAIGDDKDRNRYRLEHLAVRADGVGTWGQVIEDALTGPASQHLLSEARVEKSELASVFGAGTWQHSSVVAIKNALDSLHIDSEDVPAKSDMKRWFRLLATLRNKTRAHGATKQELAGHAAVELANSISLILDNHQIFKRPWAHLHRNLSGKYRVSPIAGDPCAFDSLKSETHHTLQDGIYIHWTAPRAVPLIETDPSLDDFYLSNGSFTAKRYELLSYRSDNRRHGDALRYSTPPGTLPPSETDGHGELSIRGNCFSNAPESMRDYVGRDNLEAELLDLLLDDRRAIVTLRGRGGIGKTSLALKVIGNLHSHSRYYSIVWLSSRDVDLQIDGPKPVRPNVHSPDDMGKMYARLVLPKQDHEAKGFNAQSFFEKQLHRCDSGPCLFVFDNFETTRNPLEMFTWIDTFIRLPNKALITTRLRDFKGDYPIEVNGMTDSQSRSLIENTAHQLRIGKLITEDYIIGLIRQSEGHPYVIKVLLGEVARTGKAGHIPHIVAASDEILTALFERTYQSLSPCAQRAFLTLAAWNSSVPRLALEAVLLRSTEERQEVENGIESLIQYSLADAHNAPADRQEFLALPLVASVFGRKKLNISPHKVSIQSDVELLQLLGPSRRDDMHLGLENRLASFIAGIASRIEHGEPKESYAPILEMICRNYPPGWLLLARWHLEQGTQEGFESSKLELRRFLENDATSAGASDAWRLLAHACYRTGDTLGEILAFVERAQLSDTSFGDVSNTAGRLNQLQYDQSIPLSQDERLALSRRIAAVMHERIDEANADDFSKMAWLTIHLGQESKAHEYTQLGLRLEPMNRHCRRLADRLGIPV